MKDVGLSYWFVHEDADARQSRRIQMRRFKMLAESRCGVELVNPEKIAPANNANERELIRRRD